MATLVLAQWRRSVVSQQQISGPGIRARFNPTKDEVGNRFIA